MSLRNNILLLVVIALTSCKYKEEKTVSVTKVDPPKSYYSQQHIIEAEDLMISLSQSSTKVIDFRKLEDYEKEHIPNALNVYRSDISASTYPYKGMMASKMKLEALFSRLGIQNGDTLVIYDDRGGSDSARLWWVLQNHDYTAVKLLNGGLKAWKAANGTLTDVMPSITSSNFRLPVESSMPMLMNYKEIGTKLSMENVPLLLDVRSADEYSGKRQKQGAAKGGRIPNSKFIDWSSAIDFHGTHKFRSFEELEGLYGKFGAAKDDLIITYCHTGVRSAHTTFVLVELLGYTNVRNYDGSWSEWSYFDDLPVEKDSTTIILQ